MRQLDYLAQTFNYTANTVSVQKWWADRKAEAMRKGCTVFRTSALNVPFLSNSVTDKSQVRGLLFEGWKDERLPKDMGDPIWLYGGA